MTKRCSTGMMAMWPWSSCTAPAATNRRVASRVPRSRSHLREPVYRVSSVTILVELDVADSFHLVALSNGGIADALATERRPACVQSLVLFEPACADVARAAASVQAAKRSFASVAAVPTATDVSHSKSLGAYARAAGTAPPTDSDERC